MADVDDQQIRTLLRKSSPRALSLLYTFYYNRLSFLAFRFTRNEAVADDIVQQAFVIIWNKRKELSTRHEQPLGKYMESIVYTMAMDYFDAQRRLVDIDELLLNTAEEDNQLDDTKREQARAMRREIATFTPREQEYIRLKIDSGLKPDQIAKVLGVSRKMVEKWNTSVNKKLTEWASKYRKRYM